MADRAACVARTSPVFALLAVISTLSTGCAEREIDPPQAPASVFPANVEVRRAPTAPGTTRIVLDANGERARISDVTSTSSASAYVNGHVGTATESTTVPVCLAPCMADLTPRLHQLRFASLDDPSKGDDVYVQIGEERKVVRHAMGKYEPAGAPYALSLVAAITGASFAATGGTLYAAGSGNDEFLASSKDLGKYLFIGGAVALAVSIPVVLLTRGEKQQGATTELRW